jgi:hypothetical protein
VYEQLLARRGPLLEDAVVPGAGVVLGGSGDGASRHALRLRLLASLAAHCRIVVREELALGLAGQVQVRTLSVAAESSAVLPAACLPEHCNLSLLPR